MSSLGFLSNQNHDNRWSIHGSLKYINIIGSKTGHRSLRLLAKSSDRGNSTKRRNLLVKLERPPKRSLGFRDRCLNEIMVRELTLITNLFIVPTTLIFQVFLFYYRLFPRFSLLRSFLFNNRCHGYPLPSFFLCNKTNICSHSSPLIYVGDIYSDGVFFQEREKERARERGGE